MEPRPGVKIASGCVLFNFLHIIERPLCACENTLKPVTDPESENSSASAGIVHCHEDLHQRRSLFTVGGEQATGWTVRISNPGRDDSLLQKSRSALGPPCLLFNGYTCTSRGLKRPECHVGHSRPCSSEVKNEWSYTSNVPICHS